MIYVQSNDLTTFMMVVSKIIIFVIVTEFFKSIIIYIYIFS